MLCNMHQSGTSTHQSSAFGLFVCFSRCWCIDSYFSFFCLITKNKPKGTNVESSAWQTFPDWSRAAGVRRRSLWTIWVFLLTRVRMSHWGLGVISAHFRNIDQCAKRKRFYQRGTCAQYFTYLYSFFILKCHSLYFLPRGMEPAEVASRIKFVFRK